MDGSFSFDRDQDAAEEVIIEAPPPVIGGAERRLHVRAFELWASLLCGRPYPSLDDLDAAELAEFEPRSVLLDYRGGVEDPRILRIGATLKAECGVAGELVSVRDVPRGSLLSRLTDHYLEIIGTRAPIGFEAEFTNHQRLPTRYRGILMPFSSDGSSIDHVLGVINWKHDVSPQLQRQLQVELNRLSGWIKPARH